MIGPLLALFTRSLREDCRSKATYATRGLLLAVTLLFMLMMRLSFQLGAPGLEFFKIVLNLNCVFITIAGLSHFASAITEEKEEMTLGLLRMTALNPLSILLGKSASRMVGAILLLLVQFPFTLLAVSLGGVSIPQVVAAYCTLAAYILLLGCVALFCSVICRRTTAATSSTLLFLIAFFFGPNFYRAAYEISQELGLVRSGPLFLDSVVVAFEHASPFAALGGILQTGFTGSPVGFQVLSNVAAGGFFFLLSWLGFNRFTRRETDPAPARGFVFRRTSFLRWFGAGRTWHSALFWKDFHFMAGGKMGVILKFVLMGLSILCIGWKVIPSGGLDRWVQLGSIIMVLSSLILGLELAVAAARIFRTELQWQTLSSISILPMTVRSLVYQKAAGHLLAATPTLFYLLAGAVLVMTNHHSNASAGDATGVILSVSEALFLIHLTAYLSLLMKRGALAAAFILTLIGNFAGSMFLALMFSRGGAGQTPIAWLIIFGLLILTGILHALIGFRLQRVAAEE